MFKDSCHSLDFLLLKNDHEEEQTKRDCSLWKPIQKQVYSLVKLLHWQTSQHSTMLSWRLLGLAEPLVLTEAGGGDFPLSSWKPYVVPCVDYLYWVAACFVWAYGTSRKWNYKSSRCFTLSSQLSACMDLIYTH